MSKTTNGAGGFAPREVGPEGGTPKGQHTPGPWTVGHEMNSERPGSVPVVAMVRDSLGGKMHVAFANGKAGEQEANASLIAAAPDLLAALRAVLALAKVRETANDDTDDSAENLGRLMDCCNAAGMVNGASPYAFAEDAARAAIAKATGDGK